MIIKNLIITILINYKLYINYEITIIIIYSFIIDNNIFI